MRCHAAVFLLALVAAAPPGWAEYDHRKPTQLLLSRGTQALMMCNGLFVSNRTLDQIYEQELKLERMPVLPSDRVNIDESRRTVAVVGGPGDASAPVMRAAYREGVGCVVLSPDQGPGDVDSLPAVDMGLDPVDNHECSAVGSCLSYFGGASSVAGALDRALVAPPGSRWDYENYDTLLAVHALKVALGARDYLEFPRRALFDRIGMRSTVAGVDRFGDFVLSSQVYTNARDLARFGLLYLNRGRWPHRGGEAILPESWVDFSRTPAPSTAASGRFYGGQWWLVPDDRKDIPADAYATAGNRGQYAIVVPCYDWVIVRWGLDWLPGQHSFPRWDLTREILKAFPRRPWGEKPAA